MFAEFINKPISGQYPEKQFGAISPNCIWVKFTDNKYQDWVGSFRKSWDGYGTFILNLEKQEKAFVVAGGEGFLVDISTRLQLNNQSITDTKSAISNDEQTIIYFSSGYDMQFVDIDGNVSVLLDNFYFDDIELVEIKDNILYVKYWHYLRESEPFRFEINLQTKEVKDFFINSQRQKYQTYNPNPSFFERIIKWSKR